MEAAPNRYLVRQAKASDVTKDGIKLHYMSVPQLPYGEVVSAGEGTDLPVGAIVFWMPGIPLPILNPLTREEFLALHKDEVLAAFTGVTAEECAKIMAPSATAPDREAEKEARKRIIAG